MMNIIGKFLKYKNIPAVLVFLFSAFTVSAQIDYDTVNQTDGNGLKNGYWKKLNAKGMPTYTGYFNHGIPVGTFTYFYPDGITKAKSKFSNNGKSTHTITYHHTGKMMSDGYYYDKKKDSLWRYYDNSGALLKEEFYRNNMKEGIWKTYYGNGNVAEEIEYKADKKDGIWKIYYDDGTLKMEASNLNGERNGITTFYTPSGNIEISGHYESSLRTGEWFYYDEDGNLIKKEIYDKGRLIKTEKKSDMQKN